MKILHVIANLDPAQGGPPRVAVSLAAAQAALGHDVTLLTEEQPGRMEAVRAQVGGTPGAARIRLRIVPHASGPSHLFRRGPRAPFDCEVADAEVVHLHNVWDPFLLPVARCARRMKRPYVLTPHGMLDPWSLRQRALKKRVAMAAVYRAMLTGARCIHALNRDEGRSIESVGLPAAIRVIPNGMFIEEIPPANEMAVHEAAPSQFGDRYVLFLSRLHPGKGLDLLAEAFAKVRESIGDVHLVVAGPDEGARAPFEVRAGQLGIADHVHVAGAIYGEQKYHLLRGATCFCLPSRQEGFSIAILEALACGVPSVISDQCHFPEVAESGSGLVSRLDPLALADALLQVIRLNPDQHRAMGDAGRRLVAERYAWSSIAARMIETYDELVDPGT